MFQKIYIIGAVLFCVTVFSFFTEKKTTHSEAVKQFYLQQSRQFENEIVQLQNLVNTGSEKQLQQQFLKVKLAYKEVETIVEYYFNFFAVKLNGPPIPFFEEDEPDIGEQEPFGLQVIEGMIFPHYRPAGKKELSDLVGRLLLDAQTLQATNESNAFSDEFIFDAITEELFRITALGITGFDSQAAGNGLPECNAALKGLQKMLLLYEEEIKRTTAAGNKKLHHLLTAAQVYLYRHPDFDSFNRMQFILDYLDPVIKIIGDFKKGINFGENRSPMFYSTIKKNNTLFTTGIFDVNKYLDDNTTSAEKIGLGKKLFFDKQLSKDNKRSCATCHDPAKAFTDGLPVSIALDGHSGLPRNAPTLWNTALQRNLFLDNRSPSLEDQVLQVLNNKREMHGSAQQAAEKILARKDYAAVYAMAYPVAKKENAAQNICNAIACYERTLIAFNSRFDKHMRGVRSLSQDEVNGFNLFMGKAKCGTCHFMPLFSGAKPPRYYYNETEVIGVPDKSSKGNARLDEDEGRFMATGLPIHKFAFKTSTLRNIALTAPYMHNGVYKTLNEVLEFYNNGGGRGLKIAPKNQTLPFEKLNLSKTEQSHIISFLRTLTDTVLVKQVNRD